MIVIKLGGSVVTLKNKPMSVNYESIDRLCGEIKGNWPQTILIVHGGGSFGHPIAKKFEIEKGFFSERQAFGFARVHNAMLTLNRIIVETLLNKNIPAISLAPSSFVMIDNGRIKTIETEIIKRLLNQGILPVLYGDAVIDRTRGIGILSGDQLAAHLAVELDANLLIFGVDVDGVFTSDPKLYPDAQIVKRLSLSKLYEFPNIGEATTTDVTGGMAGKIKEARTAVEAGLVVQILNASKPGVINETLRGNTMHGTLLTR